MIAVITTGPASAPIDGVRRITNFATGETGALLAGALADRGFETLLFRGRGAICGNIPDGVLLHEFTTNDDLAAALEKLRETRAAAVQAVFHAAALSDYTVTDARGPDGPLGRGGKIPGNLAELHLVLEPAAKILPLLRGWFPRAWITAWKYELEGGREDAIEAARDQIRQKSSDATVLNGAAYGPGFALLEADHPPLHFAAKRELAQFLASRAANFAKSDK